MKYYIGILIVLTSVALPSGLRAQYRWHVVLPDRIDSFYRGITSISCNGDNCIATEVIYSPHVGDSNVIISSIDGGLNWSVVAPGIPQWTYNGGKQGLYYDASQQIDSLNAIVADKHGFVVITNDGWKTYRVDSGSQKDNIYSIYFANASEGMVEAPFGFYWSTVDSGNHWKQEVFDNGVTCCSYGDSTFRLFNSPDEIFTTHNNWNTWDTTYISSNGPLADTSFHPYAFFFGSGDTLAIEGWRWKDLTDYHASLAMAISTDFGTNWNELAVPQNNGIYFGAYAIQMSLDWRHMVMAGNDSVGRIVQSFDAGVNWECDTVPLSSGIPYHSVVPFAVTGSGRLLAGVVDDSGFLGSSSLAYLELVTAGIATPSNDSSLALFPNPASDKIQITSSEGNISISDPLGRSYAVKQTGNTLDISSLPSGVYFVSDGITRTKFVKE